METGYLVSCSRCKVPILLAKPAVNQAFLCNQCHLRWTEIKDKLIKKGSYQDEVDKNFIKFVTDLPFLKKFNISTLGENKNV